MTRASGSSDRAAPLFFATNAAIYAGMSVACLLRPSDLATALGMQVLGSSGLSELMVAFGAIPGMLAAGFLVAFLRPRHRDAMRIAAVALYGGSIAFRLAAAARAGFFDAGPARYAFVLDCVMVAAALALRPRPTLAAAPSPA